MSCHHSHGEQKRVLLPDHLVPTHYHVHLTPELEASTFKGVVKITLSAKRDHRKPSVTLHSLGLEFDKNAAKLQRFSPNSTSISSETVAETITENAEEETATFDFPGEGLKEGETIAISIAFSGQIADACAGLYHSNYVVNGVSKYVYTFISVLLLNRAIAHRFETFPFCASPISTHGNPEELFFPAEHSYRYLTSNLNRFVSFCWICRKGMATQFEPVDARRCFPCYDEPALKSVFEVSLTVEEQMTALSNMPVVKEEAATEASSAGVAKKTIHFAPSPKMSTYLVCMVVGEYDYVEGKTANDVVVRVWGKKGESELGKFALDIGIKALNFYESFFNIKYPLPKMDMIGLANMAGAMEHWGLVTYRDSYLLCNPATASLRQRLIILIIITHELGHQWFGNLVTMEWWKELWLNEGFASWAETHCAHMIMPEYKPWTAFCRDTLSGGLELDSLLTTHPIEVEILKSRDVDEIFDDISYNKGAGVIRMLASIIGLDAFAKGISSYLTKHSYMNATTLDLWQSLSEATGKDVKAIMHPWTSQPGYPVVFIDCDESGKTLKFKQQRFLASGKPTAEQDTTIWPIHLATRTKCAKTNEISDIKFVAFDTREHSTTTEIDLSQVAWFRANVEQSGFLRVVYCEHLFKKVLEGLKAGDFGDIDRWSLVCDTFATYLAGLTEVNDLFRLLSLFHGETNNTVLGEISDKMHELDIIFGEKFGTSLRAFKAHLFELSFKALGLVPVQGEGDHLRAARPIVWAEMASMGSGEVILECRRLFNELLKADGDFTVIDPDLWAVVLNTIAANGTKDDIEEMKKLIAKTNNSDAALRTVMALGCISNPDLLLETLEWAMLTDALPASSAPRMVINCSMTPSGRATAWKMFEKNAELLVERFRKGPFLFNMMLEHMTVFATHEMADKVKAKFEALKIVGVDKTVEQLVDKIRTRATIFERSAPTLGVWFSSNGY